MSQSPSLRRGLFFTGTDTGVGKTVVTAAVARWLRARGIRVGVCKPVATGAQRHGDTLVSDDTLTLARAAGVEPQLPRVTPWAFAEPAAPPVAAAREGVTLALEDLVASVRWWDTQADVVLVEGVGGLLCPLTDHETVADLAAAQRLPLIVVARTALGTLNHTLLTLEAAARRGLPVAGVVLNEADPPTGSLAEQTNPAELAHRINVPLRAVVRHRSLMPEAVLPELEDVNWWELSAVVKE
jgi:dethiobiotin synthetase